MGNASSCILQGFPGFTSCWCKVHETWKDSAMEQPVGILDEEKYVLEKSYYSESCGGECLQQNVVQVQTIGMIYVHLDIKLNVPSVHCS